MILWFLPWKYSQQVAVVEIQCPEASHLFAGLPISGHTVMFGFWGRLRQGAHRSGLFQNSPADTLQRVALAKVPGKADKTLLSRWADGNVLAYFDLVAFTVKIRMTT